ncbi:hypothetical protein HYU18_02060 [Candidatus Woesearchaeota archaeon]|nr:hypothetical protein [Candidatus Woesearchaeota archaeon]
MAGSDQVFPGDAKSELVNVVRKGRFSDYVSFARRQVFDLVSSFFKSLTPRNVLLLVSAVVILALFGRNLKDIVLVSILAVAASYSTVYKRTIRVPSAVELVTLGTVITGAAYGPVVGALFGVVTTIASEIISSGVDVNTLFYAVGRGIAGGVSQTLIFGLGWGVVAVGMIALVIFHAVSDAIYVVSGGIEAVPKILYFIVINTLFNLIMFTFFGNLLLAFAQL